MSCNIFGDINSDIVDILGDVINNTDVDFDLFITPSFERKYCTYNDLKTKKLVIANYDICTSIKTELFPAIDNFINPEFFEVFVLTPHHLLNDSDFPTLFEYETIDFWVNQFKSNKEVGYLKYSEYKNIFKSQKDFLRQKHFLVYLGSFRRYRQKLCQYLLDHYPDKSWISYLDFNKEIEEINIKEPLDVYTGKSNTKIPNLGLFLSSYFSIIYDTIFDETYEDGDYQNVKFTDKIYRSIRMFHPFLYMGQYKALSKFKEMGFKTFDSIIDESYDLIENPQKRFIEIIKQVNFIMNKDRKELFNLVRKIEDILVHNNNQIDKFANYQKQNLNNKLMKFLQK